MDPSTDFVVLTAEQLVLEEGFEDDVWRRPLTQYANCEINPVTDTIHVIQKHDTLMLFVNSPGSGLGDKGEWSKQPGARLVPVKFVEHTLDLFR